MLNLPVYFLGSSYYLHMRINGKQVKRSLRTGYQRVTIIRAITLMDSLMRKDLPRSTSWTPHAAYSRAMARKTMPA